MSPKPNREEIERYLRRREIRKKLGSWTGFKGKSLWDLLQLLIVPALLTGIAFWFNEQTSIREQNQNTLQREIERRQNTLQKELEEERNRLQRESEQRLAEDRSREEALQNYLDKMAELLLEEELTEKKDHPDEPVVKVAQVRTVTTLRLLDPNRRRILFQFLRDSELSEGILVHASLVNVDLSGTPMVSTNFEGANLYLADLNNADLTGANLNYAIMIDVDLSKANLMFSDLRKANLNRADLSGANLWRVDLTGANLTGANLRGADLTEANLTDAVVNLEQLADASSLQGATMPDGIR